MRTKVDDLDKALLKLLQGNGDLTLKEIGARLNVPSTTIDGRLKKLRAMGIIKNKVVQLDEFKLGLATRGIIKLKLRETTKENMNAFRKELLKIKGVKRCYNLTGDFHIMVHVVTSNSDSFVEIHDQIAKIETVYDLHDSIILKDIIENKGLDF